MRVAFFVKIMVSCDGLRSFLYLPQAFVKGPAMKPYSNMTVDAKPKSGEKQSLNQHHELHIYK